MDDKDQRNDDTAAEIPPMLAAAWGLKSKPSKGPKPGLSVRRIVDTAIDTAVREGIAAVSMKRVAGELGTAAMSLYRYVSGKDELLILMMDESMGPPPADLSRPDDDWRAGIERWAWRIREKYNQHSWALNIPISGPPNTPNQVRWMEAALRTLADTSLDEGEKMGVILLVSGYIRNEVTLTTQLTQAMERAGATDTLQGYTQFLRQVTDPKEFPAVTKVLDSGVLDSDDPPDEDFRWGLDRILDGIESMIDSRT